jgi:hypothetical protein
MVSIRKSGGIEYNIFLIHKLLKDIFINKPICASKIEKYFPLAL